MTNKTIMILAAVATIGEINCIERQQDTPHPKRLFQALAVHVDPCNMPAAPLLKPKDPSFNPPSLELESDINNDSFFEMLPKADDPNIEALSTEVLEMSFTSPLTETRTPFSPLRDIKRPTPRSKE